MVRSHGRLHFGLSEICPREPNCFAGVGLMIDHSVAEVEANFAIGNPTEQESAPERIGVDANEYWKPRIESFLRWDFAREQKYQAKTDTPRTVACLESISLHSTPTPHCGLGSGTQMACTLAVLLQSVKSLDYDKLRNWPNKISLEEVLHSYQDRHSADPQRSLRHVLATLSHRGKRSNIGLQGFLEGGFIVDHGHEYSGELNVAADVLKGTSTRRTDRYHFPSDWPVLLVHDHASAPGDSGDAELQMFERCSSTPNAGRSVMLRLVSNEIVPAVLSKDWETFDRSIGQYGKLAGGVFASVQGGIYRTPQIASAVATIQRLGIQGAVQSSWGPTVCCVARDADHAAWCVTQLRNAIPSATITTTYAASQSAQVDCK
jgi:beta-ribofuranosylaminobenzene 5'-phosphate synthase